MRGRLTNTATGQTIALVEGVELARSLTFETANSRRAAADSQHERDGGGVGRAAATETGGSEREEELEVDKVLKPGLWTAFGALASSKFFMYQVRRCRTLNCSLIPSALFGLRSSTKGVVYREGANRLSGGCAHDCAVAVHTEYAIGSLPSVAAPHGACSFGGMLGVTKKIGYGSQRSRLLLFGSPRA